MRLARIGYEPEKVKRESVAMGGLNWSDGPGEGDFRDGLNLSFRRWPCLTTRKKRTQAEGLNGVTALAAHGKLAAVRGTELLLDGKRVGTVTAGEKRFAVVNTKLVVWPDMVYLDLEDNRVKPMGAKATLSPWSVTVTDNGIFADTRPLVMPEGNTKEKEGEPTWWGDSWSGGSQLDFPWFRVFGSVSRTEEGWVRGGLRTVWGGDYEGQYDAEKFGRYIELDGASLPNIRWGKDDFAVPHPSRYGLLKDFRLAYGYFEFWYEVYECPIENGSLLDHFKAGDAVAITGAGRFDKEAAVIEEVTETRLVFTDGLFTADLAAGVEGETGSEGEPMPPPESVVVGTAVTLERKVPPLEFICESQNRLWGCGGNTIWASALGDPTNFYVNKGASTDSYSVAVGTDGAFTGCAGYSEGVLFWKEDCLHKALGSYPANYEVHTYGVPGVKAGCDKSQAVISDVLYYLGDRGVYAYAGGTPRLLSGGFGEKRLSEGTAGSDGEKYYLSAKEGEKSHLLVYDPGKGLWLREDGTGARDFARLGNRLYFAGSDGKVWLIDGGGEDPEQEWMVRFAPFYETAAGRKRYSRLLLRLELPQGSWVMAEVRCDDGPWTECGTVAGRSHDVIPMRIPFNRCDKFELRLRGKGPCTVRSVVREFMVGSER